MDEMILYKTQLSELLLALEAVDSGRLFVETTNGWDNVYPCFHIANGWIVVVFNDCGDWDYIEFAVSPDGVLLRYDDIRLFDKLDNWHPTNKHLWVNAFRSVLVQPLIK